MAERHERGVLDTSVVVAIADVPDELLPVQAAITAVTLAELSQGPHTAATPAERLQRLELLQSVEGRFPAPLPFDAAAARRYASLSALVLAAGGERRPRRLDLMVAAIASTHDVPLFTRHGEDFVGLEAALRVVDV